MSEKEQALADTIKKALPKMSDFDKGYFLAKAETAMETAGKERTGNGQSDNQRPAENPGADH